MELWPAIDLRGGNCVRLLQGDYARETVFGDDPVAMVRRFVAGGARRLHIVDLDGAKAGSPCRPTLVGPHGGGGGDSLPGRRRHPHGRHGGGAISTPGSRGVILGSVAIEEPALLAAAGHAPIPAGSCSDSMPATAAWRSAAGSRRAGCAPSTSPGGTRALPLAAIVYTDIATDGTLVGPQHRRPRGDARRHVGCR